MSIVNQQLSVSEFSFK